MECTCEVCRAQIEQGLSHEEAILRSNAMDARNMEKYGWIAHCIVDQPLSIHTHGLPENFGHPDIEILLPAAPEFLHFLLVPLAEAVKRGTRFVAEGEDGTVFNVPVRFVERTECDRTVLRVIFPDPDGKFPGDPGCQPGYADQMTG